MPRFNKSARAKPGSNSPANPPPKAAPPGPQFTESQQFSSPDGPDRREKPPDSAEQISPETLSPGELSPEKFSLDATEPFPPGLFRVPISNAIFARMPEMSDSALRCLLALIRLSLRFDPAEDKWIHEGDWFARGDVQGECGLSSQGTRNGLCELESIGWARADRSGRSHQYQLRLEVPSQRFTYVPTALLEEASGIDSGTELRVVLAVLRGTWGWTCKEKSSEDGSLRTVHDRWAQLSNRGLARATGRSETAVARAAKALQGRWIERARPGSGPYQYRFLPEAVGVGSGDEGFFSRPTSNNLTPDRQNSGTPTFSKESTSKDKHSQLQRDGDSEPASTDPSKSRVAVPAKNNPERETNCHKRKRAADQEKKPPTPDFSGLSPEKRDLAEKLSNVGVWAGRIAEVLSRFSHARVRANFELYRQRATEQVIRNPGAWLYEAITEGYALPGADPDAENSSSPEEPGPRSVPDHKEVVSETEKEAYVARGIDESCFHRCLSSESPSSRPQFMYFAPEEGGPERRV